MKPEEARVFLSDMVFIESKTVLSYIKKEALQTAISALEKQIPMKPGAKEFAGEQIFGNPAYVIPCGNCGEYLNRLHYYCPWCGQKIDYGDDENDE